MRIYVQWCERNLLSSLRSCNSRGDITGYGNDIGLIQYDESKLVHDPELTSNIFNDYYVNIASQLGLNDRPDTDACPSVLAINDHRNHLVFLFPANY